MRQDHRLVRRPSVTRLERFTPRPDPDTDDEAVVVLPVGVKTRVILTSTTNPRQWALQRGVRAQNKPTRWRSVAFFASRDALRRYFGANLSPELQAAVSALPEHPPQD